MYEEGNSLWKMMCFPSLAHTYFKELAIGVSGTVWKYDVVITLTMQLYGWSYERALQNAENGTQWLCLPIRPCSYSLRLFSIQPVKLIHI